MFVTIPRGTRYTQTIKGNDRVGQQGEQRATGPAAPPRVGRSVLCAYFAQMPAAARMGYHEMRDR